MYPHVLMPKNTRNCFPCGALAKGIYLGTIKNFYTGTYKVLMTTKLEHNTSPYILKNENVLDKKKRHSKETEKITENKLFFCHEKVEEELFSKFGQFILYGIILYFYQDNLI